MDDIDAKLARINARLAAAREACPACEARAERSAIHEFDGGLPRAEAERLAREAHPCVEHPAGAGGLPSPGEARAK